MGKAWGDANPAAREAHAAVNQAVKKGILNRPQTCELCGASPTPLSNGASAIQGHHHLGYDHPLDVQWICIACHRLETRLPYIDRTHCPRNHPYSGDNLELKADGGRGCVQCRRDSRRAKRRRARLGQELSDKLEQILHRLERRGVRVERIWSRGKIPSKYRINDGPELTERQILDTRDFSLDGGTDGA